MSDQSQAEIQAAVAAHRSGDRAGAENAYRSILEQEPDDLQARLMLGILAAQTDREDLAVEHLSRVIEMDASNFVAAQWLTRVLAFLERFEEAETYAVQAANLRPHDYAAVLDLATAHLGLAKLVDAAKDFKRAIRIDPHRPQAYSGLATTFLRLGEPQQARLVLRDAARIFPTVEQLLQLGEVALTCDEPDETLRCTNWVLKEDPAYVPALILAARAYGIAQREDDVDETLRRLKRVSPDDPVGLILAGRRLQTQGNFSEAEEWFRRSVEICPQQGVAYYGIVAGRRMTDQDLALIEKMENVLSRGGLKPDETGHLHYALGKAYDNVGDYGAAMAHFDAGNRVMREIRMGTRSFDRAATTRQVDQIIGLFTKEFLDRNAQLFDGEPTPIFIAGIMRSGTTLAEQILSCHSLVGGAGEQSFWRSAEFESVDYAARSINAAVVRRQAHQYAARLGELAPGFPFVTDKNPANRLAYGLIHIAYPQSRIIHMRRNPVDVAISMYTTLIRTGAPFLGDRDDIVFALREHARLTAHWKEVLPRNRFLEVGYEELVREREATTRQMVEFCGLDWEEACLRPEENLRTVVTPSLWQVRQPVYTGSLDRWKRYEAHLGPFAELLEA